MKCSVEALSALADGDLPPRTASRVRAHLASCAGCRAESAALEGLTGSLGALAAPRGVDAFENIYAELERTGPVARHAAWSRRRTVGTVALAASFLLAASAGGVYVARARVGAASERQILAQADSEFRLAESHYRRAIERLRGLATTGRVRLTPAEAGAAAQAQSALEAATERCRLVARSQPADPEAAERLFAAYRQQIRFYEDELLRGGVRPVKAALTALVLCAAAPPALAETSEVTFAYVPAPAAEQLVVAQPLGQLIVRGWDRPEVRIVARKFGPDAQTVERLRVKVELRDGHIEVRAGVRVGAMWQALPLSEAGINLTIDAPRGAALDATTFAGGLEVFGLRAGAVLSSSGGELRVRDVKGEVKTRALAGRQDLSLIDGSVAASGVSGDVDVDQIDGDVLEVHVVEGRVTARRVSSPVVRLISALGAVSWSGPLKPGGRYELVSHRGDVRLEVPANTALRVVARAPGGVVRSDLPLRLTRAAEPERLEGELHGGGPLVLLTAEHGAALMFRIP